MIDELIKLLREGFKSIKDHRKNNSAYSLVDLLSAGFAIFSLKKPFFIGFSPTVPHKERKFEANLRDRANTGRHCFARRADGADPTILQAQFKPLVNRLRQEGMVEQRQVPGGYTLLAADGTQHFCSGSRQNAVENRK